MPDNSLKARIAQLLDPGRRWESGPVPAEPQVQLLNPMAQKLSQEGARQQNTLLQGLNPSEEDQQSYTEAQAAAQQAGISIHNLLGKALQPNPEGISQTLLNLVKAPLHPWEAAKGIGTPVLKMAKGLTSNVNSGLQAISPIDLNAVAAKLGLGDEIFPKYVTAPHSLDGEAWKDYALREGSQLSHAVPVVGDLTESVVRNYQTALKTNPLYLPKDVWQEPKAAALVTAIAQTAGDLVLPALRTLVSGQVADPSDPTKTKAAGIKDTLSALTDLFMLAAPLRAGTSKLGLPSALEMLEGAPVGPKSMQLARSLGEVEATRIAAETSASERGGLLAELMNRKPNTPAAEGLEGVLPNVKNTGSSFPITDQAQAAASISEFNGALQQQFRISQAFESPLMQGLMERVLTDTILTKKTMQNVLDGDRVGAALVRTLGDPGFTPYISRIARDSGVEPAILQQAVAATFENTSHTAGVGLNLLSQTLDTLEDQFFVKADRGSLTERLQAQKQLTLLRQLRQGAGQDSMSQAKGLMGGLTAKAQRFERLRVNFMLSNLSTAVNIARDQGLTTITDLFDGMNTGILNSVQGAAREGPASVVSNFDRNFSDSIGHLHTIWETLPSPIRALQAPAGSKWSTLFGGFEPVNKVLEAMPFLQKSLNSGLLPDAQLATASFLANNFRQAAKEAAVDAAQSTGGPLTKVLAGVSNLQHSVPQILEARRSEHPEPYLDPTQPLRSAYNTGMLAADLMTLPLKAQEKFFRKFAFRARLESELGSIGETIDSVLPKLKESNFTELKDSEGRPIIDTKTGRPKLGDVVPLAPGIRGALVNAYDHAMRQTWAATPQGGLLGMMLSSTARFNSISPIQTSMLFTPFLRAIANNLMWQAHHNPAGLTDLLLPEYQDAWRAVGERKLSASEARGVQRHMGESLTGLQLLGASMYMNEGGTAGSMAMGSKPWLWTTGPEDPDTHERPIRDLRSDPIFAAYMTAAHIMKAGLEGRPVNVTPQEAFEIFTNQRVAQTPLFNFGEEIRNLASQNDQTVWENVTKGLGKYLGPFGTVLHSLREEWGPLLRTAGGPVGVPGPEAIQRTSIQHSPLTGPFLRGAAPSALPVQYNPFTGEKDQESDPLHALAAGPTHTQTPVEYLMTKTPGLTPFSITRSYGRPEAQQLVNQATGTLLQDPKFQIGGMQVQEYAKRLVALDDPQFSTLFFNKMLLPTLHQASEAQAMKKDLEASNPSGTIPPHFIDVLAKQMNSSGDPTLQKALESQLQLRYLRERAAAMQSSPGTPPIGSAPTIRP